MRDEGKKGGKRRMDLVAIYTIVIVFEGQQIFKNSQIKTVIVCSHAADLEVT